MIRRLSHGADVVMFLWSQCERDHIRVIEEHTILALLNPANPSEVKMATNQTRPGDDRLHPFLEQLGPLAAQAEIFLYSVKIVCGKQTETNCCCVAGARPGIYATEVNIQNLNFKPALVAKLFLPLINSGAVVGREPNFSDPLALQTAYQARTQEHLTLPMLGATMDDCCRITELLLGAPPSGETGLTIGLLTIGSPLELSVSAVYTANPLNGDGISIDVEYIPPRRLGLGDLR